MLQWQSRTPRRRGRIELTHGRRSFRGLGAASAPGSGVFLSDAALLAVLLIGLVSAAMLAGCKTLQPAAADPIAAQSGAGPPAEVEPPGDNLAAVEEFLLRTQEYRANAVPPIKPLDAEPATPKLPAGTESTAAPRPNVARPASAANAQMDLRPAPSAPPLALPALERVGVRSAELAPKADAIPAEQAANAPMQAQDVTATSAVAELVEKLRSNAEERQDLESQWRWRLVQLALGRELDPPPLSAADPESGILAAFIEAAAAVRKIVLNPRLGPAEGLASIERLESAVSERADPTISSVAFCSKVLTYGVFDPMPPEEFVAGRAAQTILYSELRHYRSEKNGAGLFETRLGTRLEILSAAGDSMWTREEPEVVDTCRNRRRDFFLAQRLTIPATLPAGQYVLKAYVEDRVAGKATEASLPFTILSPISVAKTTTP